MPWMVARALLMFLASEPKDCEGAVRYGRLLVGGGCDSLRAGTEYELWLTCYLRAVRI